MTIAACYVSREGVVFGADSTTTYAAPNRPLRHYNNAQKIYEIGEMGSTLGIVTWGSGTLPEKSYRQICAELSDSLMANEPATVAEAAHRFIDLFWSDYMVQYGQQLQMFQALDANQNRNPAEQGLRDALFQQLFVGFCLGGRVRQNRTPTAYELKFDPRGGRPSPTEILKNQPIFWGFPNFMNRLLYGIDEDVYKRILASRDWHGGQVGLDALVAPNVLNLQLDLPLRDAIDWIFSALFITIKALKFSSMPPFCGGPIEVAAVTADRRFRWICHKGLDQALSDHAARGTF